MVFKCEGTVIDPPGRYLLGKSRGNEAQAIESIRKLKTLARTTDAHIWPNHDMAFYNGLHTFPQAYE